MVSGEEPSNQICHLLFVLKTFLIREGPGGWKRRTLILNQVSRTSWLVPFPQFAKDDSREGDLDHHSMIFLDAFDKLFLYQTDLTKNNQLIWIY